MDESVTTYKLESRVKRSNTYCEQDGMETESEKDLTESIKVSYTRRKFIGKRWRILCSVTDCEKVVSKQGFCSQHYAESVGIARKNKKSKRNKWERHCDIYNCEWLAVKHGLCKNHLNEYEEFSQTSTGLPTVRLNRCSLQSYIEQSIFNDQDSQTIPSQQNSSIDSISAQFETPPDSNELITEIPSLNIDNGRKNCEEQLNNWMQTMVDKIQQKYRELQMELDQLHSYIETNQDQWKSSLKDRMETKVRSILMAQLKLHETDGSELTKARDELLRAQKFYNLLNSQTMITVSTAKDNEIDLLSPRLAFSNVIVDGFTSIDKIIPKTNAEIIEQLNQQAIDLMNNEAENIFLPDLDPVAFDPLMNTETIVENQFMESDTSLPVLYNTNQSMNNNTEQADFSSIESIINNTNDSNSLSTIIENQRTDLISWFFQDHQSELEKIITNPENRMELNLTSKNLTCSDMEIVSQYALQDNKTLIQLDLSRNQIKDIGARYLNTGLQLSQTLTILDLSHNQIGDAGISELSIGLKSNEILTTLDLSDNQIKNEGAQFLGAILELNTTLTTLNLSKNCIECQGVIDLSNALHLNHTLSSLNLSANQTKDEGAQYLSFMLQSNKTLATLNLSKNDIQNKGAYDLSFALQRNQALLSLNLSENQIGDQGGEDLCTALKLNETLTKLDLTSNTIKAEILSGISSALTSNMIRKINNENM
ncbi:unnamed protein product [Adineta steineri]|uniref:Uncharacterized protein n=1 Tax=Adineta steineri TaxID=433720 RepID=A0A818KN34_9BILA|nr:unnamed protein product [Adineta steineri]CAF3557911.1 unnamed protein product [Adineta steineri]